MAIGYVYTQDIKSYKVLQLLLHSKDAKAELYLMDGYQDEWIELTYYIETLGSTVQANKMRLGLPVILGQHLSGDVSRRLYLNLFNSAMGW